MTYTKDSFRRLFQSKFNLSQWQMLLRDYFQADKIRKSPEPLEEDAEDREGYYLGNMTTTDHFNLGFFFYEMKDVSVLRRKVGLRNLVKPYLRFGIDAALAVFTDGKFWRLSLVCDLAEEATNTKRFTYVFGDEKAFYKTPIQRFNVLQKNASSFQAIKNAFSVEALSDDFFEEYRKQYADFVKFLTGKKYVKKGNKWVEEEEGTPDPQFFSSFGGDEKMVRDYVKKMMGRIVFLYFLQSKGWLAGNYHYMHDLFTGSEQKDDFLDKVLEPMFFGLLNTKPEDRRTAPLVNGVGVKYIPNADQIPYLNGGLFQQEKIDEVDSRFPAKMFQSLFDFFDSYNFTIDENDPNDAEVGVDPEMLGKIFENLLEDNKDKGAFYTPKEIVRYMCQESLIAYLQTHESDEAVKQHIANFVKTYNVEELGGASSELAASIDQRLKDVKICDPAIGSGAFPMGLLRELYACRKAIEIFDADNAADIKRHIIQNNIYGVDIEKGAVDIARLRFWLALIIDEKEPMPLPNLDFKIMQGNSLLESYKGVDLSQVQKKVRVSNSKKNRGVLSLSFDEQDDMANIQRLVKQYFDITDHVRRDECRNQINHYIKDYIKKCGPAIAEEVDDLEIPNDQFFLWHTYFADVFENGGFDIVIGNPPYIRVQNLEYSMIDILKSTFSTALKRLDISLCFIELSSYLIKNDGVCTFITSNQFLTTEYGKAMREFLLTDYFIEDCVDLGELPVFEAAMTYVSIFRFTLRNTHKIKYSFAESMENVKLMDYGTPKIIETSLLSSDNWNLKGSSFSSIFEKMNTNSICLSNIGHCNAGLITGCDKVLMFSSEDLPNISFEKEILLPVLRADNCSKYHATVPQKYVIYPYCSENGKTRIYSEEELADKFPLTYSYLLSHKQVLSERKDSRTTMGEKGLWYGLVRFGKKEIFDRNKIISPGEVLNHKFCLDYSKAGFSCARVFAITIDNSEIEEKYVLAILNSSIMRLYLQSIASLKSGGYYSYSSNILNRCPIPNATRENRLVLVGIVDDIMKYKCEKMTADTSALENKIDFLVYHLYDLTYDEVLVVDPNPPFSREEYDAYQVEQ